MSNNIWKRRLTFVFWGTMAVAYSVTAAGVVIDVLKNGYDGLAQVQLVNVNASEQQRSLAASQVAAVHRARSGASFAALPPGSTMRVVWPDGSSEYVVVIDPSQGVGVQPIAGTQRDSQGRPVEAPRQAIRVDVASGLPFEQPVEMQPQGRRIAPAQ